MKENFNYGDFLLEYRKEKNGLLHILKKKINDLDMALKESHKLQDLGYHDVKIFKNEKK
jgi:hypothetical protein